MTVRYAKSLWLLKRKQGATIDGVTSPPGSQPLGGSVALYSSNLRFALLSASALVAWPQVRIHDGFRDNARTGLALWDFAWLRCWTPQLVRGVARKIPNKFGTPICHPRKLPKTHWSFLTQLHRPQESNLCVSSAQQWLQRHPLRQRCLLLSEVLSFDPPSLVKRISQIVVASGEY